MKDKNNEINNYDDFSECYGSFDNQQLLCRKYCAISLKCISESFRIAEEDYLQDLITGELMMARIQ